MTITAKIVADSISPTNARITTLEIYYPRFIHSEFMTHRMFSRNSASSRAIPVKTMIQSVKDDPAMPIHWGKNQPGMQANEEHYSSVYLNVANKSFSYDTLQPFTNKLAWLEARDRAVEVAEAFAYSGYHKQIVNRLLEPFAHIRVCVTATQWDNFFALRKHPDAQPEIQMLATKMHEAMTASVPKQIDFDQWHLPYITDEEFSDRVLLNCQITSVARCARVSYRLHDNSESNFEKDCDIYNKLKDADPAHASPFEHQAMACIDPQKVSNNFRGWKQYRNMLNL